VTFAKTGGQYDPVGNSWTATSITSGVPDGRTFHTAVWTGTKMIVWGGAIGGVPVNTGGQYDPVSNSWKANLSTGSVPSGRSDHTAVWTGTKMIVWGGTGESGLLNTGLQRTELSYFMKN